MAYEKQTWTTGEVITQEKLNHMEDGIANAGGFECSETVTELFDETVTTSGSSPSPVANLTYSQHITPVANLTYSQHITEDVLEITFDGIKYNCPKQDAGGGFFVYGAPDPSDFSQFPFAFGSSASGNMIYTQTAGEHTVKVESSVSTVTTTPCFDKAVEKIASPLIPKTDIIVVDASGTNMSADDYTKAANAWNGGTPVIAKLGGQLQFAYMTGAEISMGGATLFFECTYIDHTDNTLRWFECTVNTPNRDYSISSNTRTFDLSSLVKN